MTPTLLELKRRSQDNLVKFLQAETKLADTFCALAQRTQNQEHRARLLGDIEKIGHTLRHFGVRIEDASIRSDISEKAETLSEFLVRHSK